MAGIPSAFESDFKELAWKVAAYLNAVPAEEADGLLQSLNGLIVDKLERMRATKRNAPKPDPETLASFKIEPIPLEVVAEAIRNYDEKEILQELEEMQNGKAYKLEDFLPELERLANQDRSPQT